MCMNCPEPSRRSVIAGAAALLAAGPALAAPGDGLEIRPLAVPHDGGEVPALLFRPTGQAHLPLVLVEEGNPGLTPALREFCARLARNNFAVLALDWSYRLPRPPAEQEDRAEWERRVGSYANWRGGELGAGTQFVGTRRLADTHHVAVVGFCGGGVVAGHYAAAETSLDAVVLFYAPTAHHGRFHDPADPRPDLNDLAGRIAMPLQAHFGLNDQVARPDDARIFERRFRGAGHRGQFYYYEGAGHGFMQTDVTLNDERTFGHVPAAAALATRRAIAFLSAHLKG